MDDSKHLLRERIKEKMTEAGLSANALEKQAGLKRSAVQNILYGRSKKPSAEILHAISRILGCSIDAFLPDNSATSTRTSPERMVESSPISNENIDIALYAQVAQLANVLLTEHQVVLSKQQVLSYIDEVYRYTLSSGHHNIDQHFAKWLFQKMLSKAES